MWLPVSMCARFLAETSVAHLQAARRVSPTDHQDYVPSVLALSFSDARLLGGLFLGR